ncbi:hypothetical protein LZ30DRAFT_417024 [Colletotrichum cereale]|nr:hypothetical protein LZ30DRAFT_417024 [Colletotrichum cereale]
MPVSCLFVSFLPLIVTDISHRWWLLVVTGISFHRSRILAKHRLFQLLEDGSVCTPWFVFSIYTETHQETTPWAPGTNPSNPQSIFHLAVSTSQVQAQNRLPCCRDSTGKLARQSRPTSLVSYSSSRLRGWRSQRSE